MNLLLQNKKVRILLGTLVTVVVFFLINDLESKNRNNVTNVSIAPTFFPTPTPFEIKNISVSAVSPTNNSTDISILTKITVTFSRPLTNNEQNEIKISFSPKVDGTTFWESSNTVSFEPSISFLENQVYSVVVYYPFINYAWSFTTGATSNLSTSEAGFLQQKLDHEFSTRQQEIRLKYPWYDNLPLSTDNYYIYFNTVNETFIADAYPKTYVSVPIDAQVSSIETQARGALVSLGIDLSKYKIQWSILPTSE